MPQSPGFRELLTADLAVRRGLASAADVATALQHFWTTPAAERASLLTEIRRVAGLDAEALRPVEEEAARLIEEADGEAGAAVRLGSGLARSLHGALAKGGPPIHPARYPHAGLHQTSEERYRDFIPVGEGGMGVVYLALDTELNRLVALKTVRARGEGGRPSEVPESPMDAEPPPHDTAESHAYADLTARFLQEAWVTGGLEHPGIVPVYELGQTPGGVPYYTMRFVRGQRTFRDALDESRDASVEERLGLIEPFLKLCDTLRYAHARGVIHRDLKPENVALGEFGEVVLLDWGLAKLERDETGSDTHWKERAQELHKTEQIKTLAGGLGTPGYMAPEAVLGGEVDRRSDIYGLGAMLFEILTARLPFPCSTAIEYLTKVQTDEPPDAVALAPDVPSALSRLCASCLARDPAQRPREVDELTGAIRNWQASTRAEREVEANLRDARAALDAAESANAGDRLGHVDRAAAALRQAEASLPDHPDIDALRARAGALREAGIRERERAAGKRLLMRMGVAALALAMVAAFGVATVLQARNREKARDLRRILRLADTKQLRDLLADIDDFSLDQEDLEERTSDWFRRADELIRRRPVHEQALATLRGQAGAPGPPWRFDTPELAWQHQVLVDLLADLADLAAGGKSDWMVRRYRETAKRIRESRVTYRKAWQETIAAISDSPRYDGLRLTAQRGLVPLGPDETSGLFEFAHIGSGRIPERDPETKRLRQGDETAIVLVLVPGGSYWTGTQGEDPDGKCYYPDAKNWTPDQKAESRPRPVTVSPFFISKYECTQAQYRAFNGLSISFFGGPTNNPRSPVEQVSWEDCDRWLARNGLQLPSEAEWEWACRAGTTTVWFSGDDEAELDRYAWTASNSDRITRAVGMRGANPFGLFDVHGNVWEWCRDLRVPTSAGTLEPRDHISDATQRVIRGGSWYEPGAAARSSHRMSSHQSYRCFHLGMRPSRSIRQETGK